MFIPLIGVIILVSVIVATLTERAAGTISFLDPHAAFVVVGGVIGSLFLALKGSALLNMLTSLKELFPSTSSFHRTMKKNQTDYEKIKTSWRAGQRAKILDYAENSKNEEIKVMSNALLERQQGPILEEHFTKLKSQYYNHYLPVIEGWELVGKLAPSFGMVGTVTGMVMLFKNMAENSGNLGGAMAMALLATLYGISLGAALGGPMASRLNNQLNDCMTLADLMEKTVASLVSEDQLNNEGS